MIDITLEPGLGRVFKRIKDRDNKAGIQTEYNYITPTLHVNVTQYESPPRPSRSRPKWFNVHLYTHMIQPGTGFGNSYEWAISAYAGSQEETTVEDMQAFLDRIKLREEQRRQGIQPK